MNEEELEEAEEREPIESIAPELVDRPNPEYAPELLKWDNPRHLSEFDTWEFGNPEWED